MSERWILIGQTPVPCEDLIEWGTWLQTAERRVGRTEVGPYRISTVFLGLDHSFGKGPPLLFETMIFLRDKKAADPHSLADMEWHYPTWLEAEEGHEQAVKKVENALGITRQTMLQSLHKEKN